MALPQTFDLGNVIRVTGTWKDINDAIDDPGAAKAAVTDGAGTTTDETSNVVNDGVGIYHLDVDANIAGTWYVRLYSEGAKQAAREVSFRVRAAQAPPQ